MLHNIRAGKRRLATLFQRVALIVLIEACFILCCTAQCLSTTAHSGTAFANDNTLGGVPFSTITDAGASDDHYASARALVSLLDWNSAYLKVTRFNFSVPATAIICGVSMTMECRATGVSFGGATVSDNHIRLLKNGTVIGSDQAINDWPSTDVNVTYGGSNTSWDEFLTPQDVNSTGFGVAISTKTHNLLSAFPSVQIDHVSMTVYYSMPTVLPLHITDFTTSLHNNTVRNSWNVAALETDAAIILQRSTDGERWQTVKQYAQLHAGRYDYSEILPGNGPYQYRLQLHMDDGVRYSKMNRIMYHASALRAYPNPVRDRLTVSYAGPVPPGLYDSNGQKIRVPQYVGNGAATLDVRALTKGMYWLKTGTTTQAFFKL